MNQYQQKHVENARANYETPADFCQVFESDTTQLYLLAFLLTGNHKDAERCVLSTVDTAFSGQGVFKGWARTWIKRALIKHAIQIVSPASGSGAGQNDSWDTQHRGMPGDLEIDAVTRLSPLERFIFVMSVLEHYSDWECSLQLGCDMKRVAQLRVRALRGLRRDELPPMSETTSSRGLQATA